MKYQLLEDFLKADLSIIQEAQLIFNDSFINDQKAAFLGVKLQYCKDLEKLSINLNGNNFGSYGISHIATGIGKCINVNISGFSLIQINNQNQICFKGALSLGKNFVLCINLVSLCINLENNLMILMIEVIKLVILVLTILQKIQIDANISNLLNCILQQTKLVTKVLLNLEKNQVNVRIQKNQIQAQVETIFMKKVLQNWQKVQLKQNLQIILNRIFMEILLMKKEDMIQVLAQKQSPISKYYIQTQALIKQRAEVLLVQDKGYKIANIQQIYDCIQILTKLDKKEQQIQSKELNLVETLKIQFQIQKMKDKYLFKVYASTAKF